MKKYLRPLGVLLALMLLIGGAYAVVSGDSLVSLSYLQEIFFPKAVEAGEKMAGDMLEDVYDKAMDDLDKAHGEILGGGEQSGLYSATLEQRVWIDDQSITMTTGSSFLMLAGSAAVDHGGVVVDVTAGAEVASGGALTAGHRYLVGEGTAAKVTVRSGEALLGVQGSYELSGGKRRHTPFYDVAQDNWFYEAVGYTYDQGLFGGVDANHFSPASPMARAQMVSVLYRLAGSPADEGAGAPEFADVPSGTWFTDSVRWAAAQGIASGTGAATFSPELGVTREQAMVMLYNYASKYRHQDVEADADMSIFADWDTVSQWARDAVTWAVDRGIIGGSYNNGVLTLDPQRGAARAEMASILKGFCEKIL